MPLNIYRTQCFTHIDVTEVFNLYKIQLQAAMQSVATVYNVTCAYRVAVLRFFILSE
jgi:hypothetical protein